MLVSVKGSCGGVRKGGSFVSTMARMLLAPKERKKDTVVSRYPGNYRLFSALLPSPVVLMSFLSGNLKQF